MFTQTYDTKNVGTNKTMTPTGVVADGNSGNNYSYTFVNSTNGTITAAPLTITADNASKCFGTTYVLGTTSFTALGLVLGETIGSVTLTSSGANSAAAVGSYPIVSSGAIEGTFTASNYNITYTDGSLTVNALPNAPTGIDGAICSPGVVNISASVGAGETVDWYDAASGGTLLLSSSTDYTTPSISSTTVYYAEARNTSTGCVSSTRTLVTGTVYLTFTAGAINTAGETICYNGDPSLTITSLTNASGGDNFITYKWQANGTDIPNTDVASFDPPSGLLVTTTFTRFAKDNTCSTFALSAGSWVITVSPTSVGGSIAGSTTVCAGTNSMTLTLSGHTGDITKWQSSTVSDFSSDIIDIANTTTTLTVTNLTTTTYFRVVVTSGACSSITTSSVPITVSPQVIIKTITGASDVCYGTNTRTLTLTAGTVGTIQWQSALINSLTNESYWTNVGPPIAPTSAVNAANTFTATDLTQNTWYRVKLTSGPCASANTFMVRVVVNPTSVAGTLSTSASEVCSGLSATLTLSGSLGIIKWYKSVNYGSLGASATWTVASGTSGTLSTGALTATTWYKVDVTSGVCSVATSNIVVVTVSPKVVIKAITGASPVCYGANSKTLTLTAGSVGSIQWQSASTNSTNELDWSKVGDLIEPTTTINPINTCTVANLTQNTWYRVKLTSGSCASVNTLAVKVIVNPTSVGGTLSTSASEVCSGSIASLTLAGSVGIIKWYKSVNYGSLGLSATWTAAAGILPTLSTGVLTATTWYKAEVTSGVCSVATSNIVVVNFRPKPVAKNFTANVTAPTGSLSAPLCTSLNVAKTFTLAAGSVGTIQWQTVASSTAPTAMTVWNNIVGATGTVYTVGNFGFAPSLGANYFRVKFSNGSCTDVVSSTLVVYYKDCGVSKEVITTEEVILVKTPFEVKAYPNPYTESFNLNIKTSAQEPIELMVYDMTGRLIEQIRNLSPSDDMSIAEIGSAYPSGVYNVVITQGRNIKKVTIIRK